MFTNEFVDCNEKFRKKKILILGLGGIGANVAIILSRAGFENLFLVDYDFVENSNLIRQYPYEFDDVGLSKCDVLLKKIATKSNNINVKKIKIENDIDIEQEIKISDFVLCTIDKPARVIRRLINNLCVKYHKPVLFCGFSEHVAMVGPFVVPNKTACLLCIEKNLNEKPLNNVDYVPSYGPLCLLISSIVSNEIINYYVKYKPDNLIGKTLMFDMFSYQSKIIGWKKKRNCKVCGCYDSKKY